MTQIPSYPSGPGFPPSQPDYDAFVPPLRTSGLAIAALVCGIISVFTCCTILPSIVGIVLGAVALPGIRRGEARGQGLAIAGLILSVLGLILGIAVWAVVALSPRATPIPGRDVPASSRQLLESLGVLQPNEEIRLFYSDGTFSIRESGVVITAHRLVVYTRNSPVESAALADIKSIEFRPGRGLTDEGDFVVRTDDDKLILFTISAAVTHDDRQFHQVLEQSVNNARQAAGKPPATSQPADSSGTD